MVGQQVNSGTGIAARPYANKYRKRSRAATLAALLLSTTALVGTALVCVAPASAADTTWTDGVGSGAWQTGGNWDTGFVPTATDDVFIDNATNFPIINAGVNATAANVSVGNAANGALQITGTNAKLDATTVIIGDNSDGNLQVNLTGAVAATGNFIVGSGATGFVTFASSATLDVGGGGFIAFGDNATGVLGFGGAAQGTFNNNLVVGNGLNSSAALSIGTDADFDVLGNLLIAAGVGSIGNVNVDGTGTTLDALALSLGVNTNSTGTMNILNDADVTVTNNVLIGDASSATGALTVIGSGSTLTTDGAIHVGDDGNGTLNILAGGNVTVNQFGMAIGASAGSSGTVNVDGAGSTLDVLTGILVVGDQGAGTLAVTDAGVVTALGGLGVGTGGANANGTMTVNGANTQVNIDGGGLLIGNLGGTGNVTVSGGGALNVDSHVFDDIQVGQGDGSTGNLTVTGAGSTLNAVTSILVVGQGGTGNLTISDGGAVSTESGIFGRGTGGNAVGNALVTGVGSTWTITQDLIVGNFDEGTLIVADSAVVSTNGLTIGDNVAANGAVTLDDGTLIVAAAAADIGFDGTGALTIANGASINVGSGNGTLNFATNVGSNGTLNIGAAQGQAAANAGGLSLGIINFGAGDGTLNLNHTSSNYGLTQDLTGGAGGLGTINQIAGVTNYTGDGSAFFGTTDISGGTLKVNSLLGGLVNVDGGTLGGNGTLSGTLNINNGGNIAPGNSIGTINVANAIFNAGSTYTVELNDGGFVGGTNNDLINATGTTTINGGNVHVTPVTVGEDGATYTPGTYTILTAAGGVTGTFVTVTDDYAFLDFALGYDANNVFLTSSLGGGGTGTCPTGMTFNQTATCGGVLSIGSGSLYNIVLALSNVEAPIALDLLSGEIHASAKTALIEDSRLAREAALDRLRTALGGAGANTGQATQETPEGATIWAQGFGAWSRWNGDGNAAEMSRNIGGLFVGADAEVTDDVYLGLMGGYSRSGVNVADRMSSASVDSYTLGAYAGGEWDAFSLKGGLAHTWNSIKTSRSVSFTGFTDSLSTSYSTRTFQAYTEAAYSIEVGNARFEPFANLAYVNLDTNGFAETGGAAALTANGQGASAAFTTIGIRAETLVALGETTAMLSGGLGWRHAFGNTPTATHNFAGGDDFTVAGVPLARDTLLLGAGFDVNLTDTAMLGVSYNGQFGSGLADHAAKARLGVKF